MGCVGQKQEVVEVTYRSMKEYEEVKDRVIEKEIGKKTLKGVTRGVASVSAEQKFGFFVVEQPLEGDQSIAVKPWQGAFKSPTSPTLPPLSAPETDLQLEYIYGYNTQTTRQTLYYTRNPSEIVYSTAALGVVLNTLTKTQKHFGGGQNPSSHSDTITSLALHPNKNLIATGELGKFTKICIWEANQPKMPHIELQQDSNSQGTSCLNFSNDGVLLAAADKDLRNTIRVWDWSQKKIIWLCRTGENSVLNLSWSSESLAFCSVGVSHVSVWTYLEEPVGFTRKKCSLEEESFVMTCAGWVKKYVFTAGQNGVVYKWFGNVLLEYRTVHSPSAVYCLRVVDERIVTGGNDKRVKVLDIGLNEIHSIELDSAVRALDMRGNSILCGFIDGSIKEITEDSQVSIIIEGHSNEVCGISTVGDEIFISVSRDCTVKVWNSTTHACINKKSIRASNISDQTNNSATVLSTNQLSGNIAVGFQDGKIFILDDYSSLQTLFTKPEPQSSVEVLAFSPDSTKLVAGCKDSHIYLYLTENFSLASKLIGHACGITAIDWSVSSKRLQSTSEDWEILYWDLESFENIDLEVTNDENWATWTCRTGWPVQGISEGVVDMSHVNAVERNSNSTVLAVGTDWGKVALFQYPCMKGANCKSFSGHSDHVSCVKWDPLGRFLLSCGGSDRSIIQWRVCY